MNDKIGSLMNDKIGSLIVTLLWAAGIILGLVLLVRDCGMGKMR